MRQERCRRPQQSEVRAGGVVRCPGLCGLAVVVEVVWRAAGGRGPARVRLRRAGLGRRV